jgi:predicted transport protein
MEFRKNKLIMYLKINPDEVFPLPEQARDVRGIGHLGTGDFEIIIRNIEDFHTTKHFINLSLRNIGG